MLGVLRTEAGRQDRRAGDTPVGFRNPSNRVFEAEGDIASELPTIRVAYHVLGDRLDFKMLAVLDPPS
jgi:hypothetical protein